MIDVQEHVYADDPRNGPSDVKTMLPGVDYFFLGNGRIQAAVQIDPSGEGTPLGLLFMDPEKLCKKRDALSFDAEQGLQHTQLLIYARGDKHAPSPGGLKACWELNFGVPAVFVAWSAGAFDPRSQTRSGHLQGQYADTQGRGP